MRGRISKLLITSLAASSISLAANAAQQKPTAPSEQQFINMMVAKHQFNKKKLTTLLAKAPYYPKVIDSMNKPFEKKAWNFYQNYFVTPERIALGVKYWDAHAKLLKKVQNKYGVPAKIIVAVLGVETLYGTHTGVHPVLRTLKTLAFHYPSRAKFFQKELAQYLLLTRNDHLNPLTLKGSYAGALGIPQFMPSSYRYYGVDYSKTHRVDLFHDNNDAIASVANYLRTEGWRPGQKIAVPAIIKKRSVEKLATLRARQKYTIAQLRQKGATSKVTLKPRQRAALIALQKTTGAEYWIALPNFRSIMNYNPSINYAMAVFQLGQALQKAKNTQRG